ncbi:MAG: DUF4349 domain-containing protein [Actinobacteria bacterium]|nr:MAG: DUF4349 domain-containing protein [Actinomycetota bacterium]
MSEPRSQSVVRELRAAAPSAPDGLRERVRALPQPSTKRALRLRPALAAAVAIAIAVGLSAAFIGSAGHRSVTEGRGLPPRAPMLKKAVNGNSVYQDEKRLAIPIPGMPEGKFSTALIPAPRLQDYRAQFRLRVRDLSAATKSAIRTTRRLDGYVAAADYSTGATTGDSSLDLRVPVQRVQDAIANFSELGTIISQQISVADLQGGLDSIDRRIAAKRRFLAKLERSGMLSPAEVDQDTAARSALRRLLDVRSRLVRQGAYAKISLSLTTRKPAARKTQPGRFDRFWGDAGDILGKEAIVVLYALVVTGPFLLLAALALLGERARRRRADSRLLEETG